YSPEQTLPHHGGTARVWHLCLPVLRYLASAPAAGERFRALLRSPYVAGGACRPGGGRDDTAARLRPVRLCAALLAGQGVLQSLRIGRRLLRAGVPQVSLLRSLLRHPRPARHTDSGVPCGSSARIQTRLHPRLEGAAERPLAPADSAATTTTEGTGRCKCRAAAGVAPRSRLPGRRLRTLAGDNRTL
ncbi:uncharacterized protein METZ01_LOCUS510690, partial [marine metagenome]